MKLDLLAFGAHPDDVELGCGGTIAKTIAEGKKVGIVDFTQGEMSTRGTPQLRALESQAAADILGVSFRENLNFKDAFIVNDHKHQMEVIAVLRKYQPKVVLCNAIRDRHTDHAKASDLVSQACFLSGLRRIETHDEEGNPQTAFRPQHVFHYIQWEELTPDFVVDISGFLPKKMEAIRAFKSQFYDEKEEGPQTPISSLNFLESVASRAKNMGRLIYKDAAEGFTTDRLLGIENFNSLL
ncbi:MAG: bacillithiol biosynthesis deacetylase BshB1 [Flavobacteriaceae bacterium TMED42]|nr:MAG: bacillithiol biosynthesis deacetylase BshB1 [Kiritimatiellaceae bacterium TMED266]RPG63273.1 MAG: bacillithiol biosynthesis deacetylase BshB1 [Flavobacteriaceae bacterium TMED42]RPG66604.1 MAG: bacillithiol biosynthesis deacetylase BshB1 [Flavobacteriaceae bacterium TMED42]|tara:strand:- start:854 stop:1573 length:720 start_codon:yes stop_codon:yes gene_type:complete